MESNINKGLVVNGDRGKSVNELKESLADRWNEPHIVTDFYVTVDGRIVNDNEEIRPDKIYRFHPRLPGGKGGFGSMLRALGAQIEKTTNREACRDLSGRRMRDLNNEKKLKEWVTKAPEREKQKQEKKGQKGKNKEEKHYFDSTKYDEQRKKIMEDLDEAVETGLSRPKKRKAEPKDIDPSKAKSWFGVDLDDSDESDDGMPEKKSRLDLEEKENKEKNKEKESVNIKIAVDTNPNNTETSNDSDGTKEVGSN